jgi:predicted CXXCH cytochrome family protein
MAFVIRRWVRTNKTTRQREYREIVIRSRQITVGRAQDQHLLITDSKVEPQHAVIERRASGRLVIKAVTQRGFQVNRKRRRIATLVQGDIVRIGNAAITIDLLRPGRAPVLGFGHVAEPEPDEVKKLYVTSLSQTGVSKSFWSWTLALSITAMFMLIPFAGLVYSQLREPLRATTGVPSDGAWTSGPLHASHQSIGADCNACHLTPFKMVKNEQCVTCHDNQQHHVDVVTSDVAMFEKENDARCASCHHEHSEPSTLVQRDQRLCTDCHERLDTLKKQPELMNVADFGKNHPDFRLSILKARGTGNLTLWERVRIPPKPETPVLEKSNLSFSHAQHLDPKGIRSPEGDQVLQCEDCHRQQQSGRRMAPITMEAHCSRCHSLLFDENDSNTKVPHGDLKLMYKALQEHFSRQFFEPTRATLDTSVSSTGRRRPGGAVLIDPSDQRRARDWIEQKTLATAQQLLEDRVCVDCHQVEKVPGAVGLNRWIVDPVRLTDEWMPMAMFDHKSHITSPCTDCHKNAERSEKSSDIMMPGIETCRDCHGGAKDTQKLASDCLMCHQFHLPNRGLFDADATMRMKGVLNANGTKRKPQPQRTSDAGAPITRPPADTRRSAF